MRLPLSSRAALPRHKPLTVFTCLLLLANPSNCKPDSPAQVCFNACQSAISPLQFGDTRANQTFLDRACHGAWGIASLYLCLEVNCTPEARSVGLAPLNETCREGFGTGIPAFEDVVGGYTRGDVEALRRVELEEARGDGVYREVVLPSERYFKAWWDTLDSVAYVNYWHDTYGASMMVFWAVVVALGTFTHVFSAVANSRLAKNASSLHHAPSGALSSLSSWFNGAVTIPATMGDRRAQKVGWGTVPPRIQSLTLVVFLAVNVVFGVMGYRIVPVNLYFETEFRQILRYVSDRTGIISFANFPLIWLFGMRNNVAMWLTGWDFGTYSNFHRWVARIATVQAVVHSIGYSILVTVEGGGWSGYWYWYSYMFWWTGVLATISMSLLVLLSIHLLRRRAYELFLVLHILLSALVLVTMLLHVSIFDGEYDAFFWWPCAIWLLDRLLRALRILAFNPFFWNTRASATYDGASDIVRLDVPCGASAYEVWPGTYYYLHVLDGPRPWESHPFTVAAVRRYNQPRESGKMLGEQVPLLEPGEPDPAAEDARDLVDSSSTPSMTFLIRPYDGFTSRLKHRASAHWPSPAPLRVLVDGPYGHTQPLHLFSTVVFIVGGSGIVVPLSHLQSLTSPSPSSSQTSSLSPIPHSIHIHWSVREPQFAHDVLQTDLAPFLSSPNLSITLYLTGSSSSSPSSLSSPPRVNLRSGRIDAPSVVRSSLMAAPIETLAVVACGPAQMADAARKTVAGLKRNGATGMEYFEESFEW